MTIFWAHNLKVKEVEEVEEVLSPLSTSQRTTP